MDEEQDSLQSCLIVIIVLTLFIILFMYISQANENQELKQKLTLQAIQAEDQRKLLIQETQIIENKIKNCIGINETLQFNGQVKCVIGRIVDIEEDEERTYFEHEPIAYYTYFRYTDNKFYIYGPRFLDDYLGDCVMVRGKIKVYDDISFMIALDIPSDFTIERLPDDICKIK